MNGKIIGFGIFLFLVSSVVSWRLFSMQGYNNERIFTTQFPALVAAPTPIPTPTITLAALPAQKQLPGGTHTFQTFNNCGPASLSMALSYYDITVSQQTLGQSLRPYQVPGGDNDDKSVTLAELAEKAKEYNLIPYHRPGGTIEKVKLFLSYDMPVIVRTTTKPTEDIGHFRIITGYDETTQEIIQDDSLQGNDLRFSYASFDALWQIFGYEFLVLVPAKKQIIAEAILGSALDEPSAWRTASAVARAETVKSPDNIWAWFNLSVALYHTGDFAGSVSAFEHVETRLPFRTLWYQREPLLSYYHLGQNERIFMITDAILNGGNRAYSELYLIRGDIYKTQGNTDLARSEYEKAVMYNKNLKAAQDALTSL